MKRKKSGGGGASWMDTYGDMVTLLLCFFVLLYSMSSVDEKKWLALVRSFNPNAVGYMTETSGEGGAVADDMDGLGMEEEMIEMLEQEDVEEALESLYQAMVQFASSTGSQSSIDVTKGDGYVFISFDDAVFFDGDSYVLRPDGQQILGEVAKMLNDAAPTIDEVRVMGHTAQARADQPNTAMGDRFLSSNRATEAAVYVQQHAPDLDGSRIVTVGYGQHRPVDSNETAESRSHNRRVEFIITGRNLGSDVGDAVEQYYTTREGAAPADTAGTETPADTAAAEPAGEAE